MIIFVLFILRLYILVHLRLGSFVLLIVWACALFYGCIVATIGSLVKFCVLVVAFVMF